MIKGKKFRTHSSVLFIFQIFRIFRSSDDKYSPTLLDNKYKSSFKLLESMKQIDPQQRPDCKEILDEQHQWAINGKEPEFLDLLQDFPFKEENYIQNSLLKLLLSKNDQK
jgi:hypothetical protein